MTTPARKLIEVALPLAVINEEAGRRKRKAPAGYPTALHKWWAQRPLAAARAVIFAQMVDDPSSQPHIFKTPSEQDAERERLFRLMENLILWENSNNGSVLREATDEIRASWKRACLTEGSGAFGEDQGTLPPFVDPFAGAGSLPLEAQRLGITTFASDLNPVAVLITKAMVEIPPLFRGLSPVSRSAPAKSLTQPDSTSLSGLAEDVRHYGSLIRKQAVTIIGHLYPTVTVTSGMAKQRDDLKPFVGKDLVVAAYIWARTVESPNPAYAGVHVPLASTFLLAEREGREAYVEPVISKNSYAFRIRTGDPKGAKAARGGTKLGRGSNFRCLLSGEPIPGDYIKEQGVKGLLGERLMAVVAEGVRGRLYLSPTPELEATARAVKPSWTPDLDICGSTQYIGVRPYGLSRFDQLFTGRQLVSLETFSRLVGEIRETVYRDALAAGLRREKTKLADGGHGALAYAEAVQTYLAFAFSRMLHYGSALCTWLSKDAAVARTFTRQALPMSWDFCEGTPFGKSSAGWSECVSVVATVLERFSPPVSGSAAMADAASPTSWPGKVIVSTDPPYYDNVPYADLSDYFYVWLRPCLKSVFPDLFGTLAVPKKEELVAFAYRHKGKQGAEAFFLDGMTRAMHQIAEQAHPAFPVTIYYAFRQSESEDDAGDASTGWETFLEAVIRAGFAITGTWPLRTEGDNRQRSVGTNALASSIVLVCRPRPSRAQPATRREFVSTLKAELPIALGHLQHGNIAPVDLAQAAIGPGMGIYTRFASVLDASGAPLSVRDALALINQVLDETLADQEGDFDADSRWAITWFDQFGFDVGEYGVADRLSTAKNTSVSGLAEAGIVQSGRGKVRLLTPAELPSDWDPSADDRVSAWVVVHHLIRVLGADGEAGAALLVANLGTRAEVGRELAYRLYTLCERKKRAPEALAYNGLVLSWPEITRLASEGGKERAGAQGGLFEKDEE